jgi:hypothetical protein
LSNTTLIGDDIVHTTDIDEGRERKEGDMQRESGRERGREKRGERGCRV